MNDTALKQKNCRSTSGAANNCAEDPSPQNMVRFVVRDNSPIRVALAGLGKMGLLHAKAIGQLASGATEAYYKGNMATHARRLCICAICDTNDARRHLFPALPFATNWRQLLEEMHPHLALIATPTATHVPMTELALLAGAHTLVEKPLATSIHDYKHLRQTANRSGAQLLAGHVERYNPVAIKLRELITTGSLTPDTYIFQRTQPLPDRITDDIITDKLIHDVDLALYFFGPVANAQAIACQRRAGRIVEAKISLRHENGTRGSLFVSWLVSADSKRRQVELFANGTLKASGDLANKTLCLNGKPLDCAVPGWISSTNNQLKDQMVDFLGYCLTPAEGIPQPLLAPDEIGEAIAVIEKVHSEMKD